MPIAMITPTAMWRQVDAPYTRLLQEAGFDVRFPDDSNFTRGRDAAETIRVLRGVSGLVAGGEFLTEEVIAGLPELRVIARAGVGYDRVDVAAATRHGVLLTITPTANHEAVAEQAMGLLLALATSPDATLEQVENRRHVEMGAADTSLPGYALFAPGVPGCRCDGRQGLRAWPIDHRILSATPGPAAARRAGGS